jgi:hypothetical protein
MKCRACDVLLAGEEITRKSLLLGDYIDLCNRCFKPIEHLVRTTSGNASSDGNEDPK